MITENGEDLSRWKANSGAFFFLFCQALVDEGKEEGEKKKMIRKVRVMYIFDGESLTSMP